MFGLAIQGTAHPLNWATHPFNTPCVALKKGRCARLLRPSAQNEQIAAPGPDPRIWMPGQTFGP